MCLEFINADFISIKLLWIFFGLIVYENKSIDSETAAKKIIISES